MKKPPMSHCPTPFGEGDRDMGRCAPGTAAARRLGLRPCGSEFAYRCAPAGARVRRGRSHKHFIAPTTTVAVARPQPAAGCTAGFRGYPSTGKPSRSRHRAVMGDFQTAAGHRYRKPRRTIALGRRSASVARICSSGSRSTALGAKLSRGTIRRQRLEVGPVPGIRRCGRRWARRPTTLRQSPTI